MEVKVRIVYFHRISYKETTITIIITGASSGIGAQLARLYAKEGDHLILLARRLERLEILAKELEPTGVTTSLFEIDITDFKALQAIAMRLKEHTLDLVILNAGISTGHTTLITPFEVAKKVYDTNLLSLHAFLEPLLPIFERQKQGHIVFISSLASLFTMPSSLIYSSSKRAMNAYAEGLRYMLKPHNIDISVIQPGFIQSELTDKNDFKMPFLLSLEEGTKRIVHAIDKRKAIYAFPLRFVLIIKLLNCLPLFIRQNVVAYRKFNKE